MGCREKKKSGSGILYSIEMEGERSRKKKEIEDRSEGKRRRGKRGMKEKKKETEWLHSSVGRASIGIAEVLGSNPPSKRKTLDSNDQNQGC